MRHNHTQTQGPLSARRVAAALLLLILGPLASASPEDTQQPIHIEADRAEINEAQGVMTYTGHVVLRQGGIELRADTLVVYAREDVLQRITAEGAPVHYRQERADQKEIRGASQRMEYDAESKRLLLLGEAEFWQGGNRFSGNRIQYDQLSEQVIATAGENAVGPDAASPRVTVTLQPREKAPAQQDGQTDGQPNAQQTAPQNGQQEPAPR